MTDRPNPYHSGLAVLLPAVLAADAQGQTDRYYGEPFQPGQLAAQVFDEGSLKHRGKPVIFRFQLRHVKLFGIEFY